MNIKGTRTEFNVSLDVDPEDLIKAIYEYTKINYGCYVKNDKVFNEVDYDAGCHSYSETELVSEDSNTVELVKSLKFIKDYIWNKKYKDC